MLILFYILTAALATAIHTALNGTAGYTSDVAHLSSFSAEQLSQLATQHLTIGDVRAGSTTYATIPGSISFTADQIRGLMSGNMPPNYTLGTNTIQPDGYSFGMDTGSYTFNSYRQISSQAQNDMETDTESYAALAAARRELHRLLRQRAETQVEGDTLSVEIEGTRYTSMQAIRGAVANRSITEAQALTAINTHADTLAAATTRNVLDGNGAATITGLEATVATTIAEDYPSITGLSDTIRERLVTNTTASVYLSDYQDYVRAEYRNLFYDTTIIAAGTSALIDDIPNGIAAINTSYIVESAVPGVDSGRYYTRPMGSQAYTSDGNAGSSENNYQTIFNTFTADRDRTNEQLMMAIGSEGSGKEYQAMDWAAFAAIQKSIQVHTARSRLYYMYNDAYLSALSSTISSFDETSVGVDGVSSDMNYYDQRVAMVNVRYQNILAKTNELAGYNNAYHQITAQLEVQADTAYRALTMTAVWAGLVGGIMMLFLFPVDVAGAVVSGIASACEVASKFRQDELKQNTLELLDDNIMNTLADDNSSITAAQNFDLLIGRRTNLENIRNIHNYINSSVYNSSSVTQELAEILVANEHSLGNVPGSNPPVAYTAATVPAVTVNSLFSTMDDDDIVNMIHFHMTTNYTYRPEALDRWSGVAETIASNAGDCEDLAFVEAALLTRALEATGFENGTDRVKLSVGEYTFSSSLVLKNF